MRAITKVDCRASFVAVIGVVGGAAIVTGAVLPWLTVFQGVRSYSGVDGVNGRA